MEQLEIPVYRHSKSNHVYSYRVKIALLVFRKRLRLSYAQFITDLPSYPNVLKALDLEYIPDKTTLIRFAKVVDHEDLQAVICAFKEFAKKDCVVAVDCTGFSIFLRSAHFAKRCKEFGIKKEPRSFTKSSFAVDTESHLILSARVTAGRRHDITFIPEHVKDLESMLISHALMDKGYDCEALHKHVRHHLDCVTVIPCRQSRGNYGFSTHGIIRNQMKTALKEEGNELRELYKQRPQVETVNFMVKTHEGSHILSRFDHTKITEGLCMALAHNCKVVTEKGLERRASA